MPIYKYDNKIYNIPDDKVDGFEQKYPDAVMSYQNDNKIYEIPASKRKGFEQKYPNATSLGWGLQQASTVGDVDMSSEQTPEAVQAVTLTAEPEPTNSLRGFKAGASESWKGLKAGTRFAFGELANMITGSSDQDANALYKLDEMLREGKDVSKEVEGAWTDVGRELRTGALEFLPGWMIKGWKDKIHTEADKQRVLDDIRDVLGEAGGDVAKARQLLAERAEDKTFGDVQKTKAAEEFAQVQPTEGFGAWLGSNTIQMIPSASALIVGALTKSPTAARAIGMIGMGGMTAATAGSSMYEAREAGASDLETRKVGVIDGAIEYITEKLPFDNYTNWMVGKAKSKVSTDIAKALRSNSPIKNELEDLLIAANKELGGRLFSKKNLTQYIADMAAEGLSEFTAEASQTMTKLIYEDQEKWPLLKEAVGNGMQGMLAGLFMGAVLGGASMTMEHNQNKARRKEQGYVDVGVVNFGTAENPENEVVEVLFVDEDTQRAQVLRNGAIENVNKDAIGQSYRFSYNAFEAARKKVEESEALDNMTVTEGQVKAASDRVVAAGNTLVDALKANGKSDEEVANIMNEANMDRKTIHEDEDVAAAYDAYLDARERERAVFKTFNAQKEFDKTLKREEIAEATGGQFWREASNNKENGVVTWSTWVEYGELQDGRKVYITSDVNEAGECAGITADGQKIIVKPDMLKNGTQVVDLDEYLTQLVSEDKAANEQTRMGEQTQDRVAKAKASAQPGTDVNIGTMEEPIVAKVINQTPDGVIVESASGVSQLTWDEYANAMNIGSPVLTDEETASFEAAEILGAESAYQAEQVTTPSEIEDAAEQTSAAVEEEKVAEPLPLKKDGSVDQTTLWNQNPRRWAEWNDEQRQDGGANSLAYITNALAKEQKKLAGLNKVYQAESDFDVRATIEKDMAATNDRIAQLAELQQKYAPVEEVAEAESVQEVTEQPETTEEQVVEEVDTMEQRVRNTLADLYGDDTLSDQEIDEYIAANVAGSQSDLDKHLNKAPKMGRDMAQYKEAKAKHEEKTKELQAERDFWKSVQEYTAIPETEMDMEPQNALEFTAKELSSKTGIKLQKDSFRKHTGYKGELSGFRSLFKTKENGGMTMEEAGERLMEMDREYNLGLFDQNDPNAGLNTLLDLLQSAEKFGDISRYIKNARKEMRQQEIAAARSAMMNDLSGATEATEIVEEVGDIPDDIWEGFVEVTTSLDEDMPDFETRLRTEQSNAGSTRYANVMERAKAWEKRLGVKVRVIEDVNDVTDAVARDAINRGAKATGWFDPNTGEVCIYAPNITSVAEIDKTAIHEVVSHKGLRGLLGKKGFNALCDSVWKAMTPEARAKYLQYENVLSKKRKAEYLANPKAFAPTEAEQRAAADEFIARYSESVNVDKNAWQKMIDSVKRFIHKLTGQYSLGDQLDELIENSLARYEEIAKMELKGVVEEGQTYKGVIDAETGAMINPGANVQAEGNTALRAADGMLVGMHNISEDKLRKAIKQGGLANPSTAVVNIAEYSLEGYGDISLIMPSSLVDPETGDNIGTYTGDAWTPTYPTISRQIDDAGWKIVKDRIRSAVGGSDDLYHDIVNSVDNYLSDDRNSRLEFVFLKEKGIEPKIELKGADGYVGLRNLEAILGVEGLRDSMESYEKYKAASPMAKRSFNMWQRVGGEKKAHKALKDEIRQYPQFAKLMGLDEDLTFAGFDSFTYSIFRKEYDAGNVNTIDTLGGASRYVDANDMRSEFDAWLESLMNEAGAKEVFFAGWTRDGDRIYKDNTLENVSRHMRMQGRTNAYDDHGLSATKSALLQRLTSLAEIRKNRARLQDESTYDRAYDKLKDRLFSIISQLADMEKISDNPFMNIDYAEARLQEAITKRNPISYLNKEYGYSIDPKGEYANELKSFIKDVQKMPAKYFETKFERPVYLNEFAAAVMPNNTSEDVKQAITEAGLPIFEYDSAVEGARREATLKATEEEGVRFRILGEMGAANLDAAEEATTRLDNLDIARQMEEAGKDAKTIKLATGWERGVDNLWRYEVPDEYNLADLEKRLQEELDNGAARTWGIVYPSDLGQLLKEYPDFNVDIMVWVGDEFENTGAYSPATEGDENTFGTSASIEVKAKTVSDIVPILAHEIQHVIQEKEGFAEGGQARGLNDKLSAELDKRVATIKQLREEGRNKEADELMQMSKGLAEAVINNDEDAYGNYKKLAGEVEARNAAKRIGKSLQERRESLLSETEEVAREDQIILMEGLGVNHMADGNGGVRLTSSNASIARFDKVNGTDVRGFIDFLKNDKEFVAGKPTVFHIANAGDLLGQFGIKGKFMVGQFTFSRTHTVNADHELGVKEWIDVINNLNNPIAITSYKGQPNQFRIYTYATINGRNICVGVNVSTKDGSIELANIISAYGRDIQNLLGNESVFLLYPATIQELKQKISQVSTAHNSLLNATSSALSADKVSNNLGENNTRFRTSNNNQAIFVSNAAKAVDGIKQEKATPEQWLKMIEKNGGLKAGEDKWMGLSDWLKASDKKTLAKREVLDFINENMIVIEEQHYEEDVPDEEALWYKYEESEEGVDEINYQMQLDAENHAELALAGRDLTDEEWEEEYDRLVSDYIEDDLFGSARSAAKDAVRERWMEEEAPKIMKGRPREINTTRLDYTTAGLTNLHEIALTVPTIESWNVSDDIHFGDAGEGRAVAWIRFGETTKWEKENREDGKRGRTKFVLVIDEIQSKRHQEGRDKGYKPDWRGRAKLRKNLENADKEVERIEAEMIKKYGSVDNIVSSKDWDALEAAKEARREARLEFSNPRYNAIPDAPFDKNWHELAMKRMLRYAAENGYDYIAWTKGDQQAERYNIGNVVEYIDVAPYEAENSSEVNGFDVSIATGGVSSLDLYVTESGEITSGQYGPEDLVGKQLSDVVGKDLAAKILSTDRSENSVRYEGEDFRIGGEGMKGFYDKMLPAFMNKYGKKWGVKVEEINLPGLENGLTMHSIPVTEEMKASVMEGQVMLRVREENESAVDFHQSVVDEYLAKYNDVAPISVAVVGTKQEYMDSLGITDDDLTDEEYAFIKHAHDNEGAGGYYDEVLGIIIFAREDNVNSLDVMDTIFHESIHKLSAEDVKDTKGLGQWLWDNAYIDEDLSSFRDLIGLSTAYEDGDYHEEMIAHSVAWFMTIGGTQHLSNLLPEEHKGVLNEIFNHIWYDSKREDSVRQQGSEYAAYARKDREARKNVKKILSERQNNKVHGSVEGQEKSGAGSLTIGEKKQLNVYFPAAFRIVDSNGNKLTPKQEEFFANSKAVDKEGNLLALYHGTPRAGFTEFKSGWFTTSKEDAISYSGDRKGRMFDPSEKYEAKTIEAGDYPLGYMTFDSEEDRAQFLERFPYAAEVMSERGYESARLSADEEYDELTARRDEFVEVWDAYREYERDRFVDSTINDLLSNPEAYTEDDFRRAILAYDSNAYLDEVDEIDDATERKSAFVDALNYMKDDAAENGGDILDIKVATRVPRNGSGVIRNDTNARTYEVYANVEKPYEIDAKGRSSEFESGDVYDAVRDALANDQYDGVIIRNWRVGRHQQLGDVVVPKNGSQIKLTSNENPSEAEDTRFRTSMELDEEFGDAWRNQQNEDGRHSTQVANTKSTYEKIGNWMKGAGLDGASILDASSGLGLGTQALREMGFQVDDVEPFPSENREAPTFASYDAIDGKYDVVISNAVLNVIPDDWRADVLHKMAAVVKDGGKIIINTRPASNISKQGVEGKTRITLDSPSEILVKRGDRIAAYQKGFTSEELAEWIESELGEGWRVEKATKKNSGISGEGTAVIIREIEPRFRIGTPTEEVVTEGVNLSKKDLASLAGNIFAALPEESRKKITDGLNGNLLGLQDAIFQIPTSLAVKEEWNDEDNAIADVIAEQMTKAVDKEMTRPFSASEALWLLYNVVNKSTDLVSEASRALVKRNLGFGPETLEMLEEANDGIRFRTVGDASDNARASLYNKQATNVWSRLKESFVDMNASVEGLVKAIEQATGKVAKGFENVLSALNHQPSKGLKAMQSYEAKFLKPMLDEVRRIMKEIRRSYDDVVRYVILKHGLERNDAFAKRDAREFYRAEFDKKVAAIEANASLSDAEKLSKKAEAQREFDAHMSDIDASIDAKYREFKERDYSGLTSMFYDQLGVDRKNYRTEEEYQAALMDAKKDKYSTIADIENAAEAEVLDFERSVNTDELWKRINASTKEILKQQYEANMISKDQYESLRDMFEYYVPLRGFKDNTAEDMYTYYRKPNSSGYTKPILAAEGRKTEAESPFGWIASMAGSAIASNVKNEAKLALYYFVSNRPDNGIATISKTWFVDSGELDADGKKIFKPVYPPFSEDLSSDAAKAAYEAWQENMRQMRDNGQAYESGQKLSLGNAVVNISDAHKPEHVVTVKVGGKDYTIVINGNPRAAQAINGDLNIETVGDYSKFFGPMLRWLSSVNTSYNPEFWFTNMQRDMLFTVMNVSTKDPAFRAAFRKNYMKAFKVISMVRKDEKGTLGDSYMEDLYKEFTKYGGVTGYTQLKDNEEWEKEIAKYMDSKDAEQRKIGKTLSFMKRAFHAMHRFGESLEQVSRFAAFVAARETGMDMTSAIDEAKEITVNFNRKGSGKKITFEEAKYLTDKNGQPLNKLEQSAVVGLSSIAPLGRRFIMFFNASIQGLNSMYRLYRRNPSKMNAWMLGYAAIGVMQALLHSMMDDDDEYLDIPEYERRNSLLLGGNGVYFKWALPQEARAAYALGDLAVESILGRNVHESIIGEALKISSEILPVNPTEGARAFLPSAAIPFVELAVNEDYKGDPIFNEQKWLSKEEKKHTPKWESSYKGTGAIYIGLSKLLNNITDGKDADKAGLVNLQPEKIEHLVQSAFGGTLRTMDKFFNMVTNAIDPEEEVTVRQTPFLNRFLTINDERFRNAYVNDVYDYYAAEAEHAMTLLKQYKKDRDKESYTDLLKSDEYKWAQIYSKYKKPIKKYQEAIRAADTTRERMELMKQQDELKRRMIKEISEL